MTEEWRVRCADLADYPLFARLFVDLGVDDAVPDTSRFGEEIVSSMFVAEDRSGAASGYVYFHAMPQAMHVRQLVTAKEARRRGVARALLLAVAQHAQTIACKTWFLNVVPTNQSAIALYKSVGLSVEFRSHALVIDWDAVEREARACVSPFTSKALTPADERAAEALFALSPGQLASARTLPGRVLSTLLDEAHNLVGVAVFDPRFPGAYPFRVRAPQHAAPLLASLRPYAIRSDSNVNVMVEGQPLVAEALLQIGARLRLEVDRMTGALPA